MLSPACDARNYNECILGFRNMKLMTPRALLAQLAETDLRLLRVFIAIAESGGLAAAELRLNIGRSVVSRHLQRLESRLGLRLCRRGRRGFALTEEGQAVLAGARRLLAQLDAFRTEILDLQGGLRGELNLIVFDKFVTNPACRLADTLRRFADEAPAVRLNVSVGGSGEIERGLVEGRFHLAVQPFHRASDSLESWPLFAESMRLYCAIGHPLVAGGREPDEAAIRAARLVGLGHHSPNMETFWRLGLSASASAHDQEASAALILSERYAGFLPEHYAARFVDEGRMCAIGTGLFQYRCDWHVFVSRGAGPSRGQRRFIEILRAAHASAEPTR